MTIRQELAGAALLAGPVLLVVVAAELWARRGRPDPEWTRKLVHVGGGIACLFIPFLIASPWTVLVLAGGLSTLFALGGRFGFLKCLHGVPRSSRGSEYYPLAILLVFVLSQGRPWLYISSVLVLAVADAMAALIGGKYGVIRYEVEESHKSLEGSVVFLVITFLAIHLPILLMTDYPRSECVLAALVVATLVTGFEAISLRGADNIFVPIGTCLLLNRILGDPLPELTARALAIPVLCVPIGLAAWKSRSFNVGAAIVFILFAYATWILGSVWWSLPAFIGFFIYVLAWIWRARTATAEVPVRVRVLTRALLPLLLILVVADTTSRRAELFGPYLAAGVTVISLGVWHRHAGPGAPSGPARWLGAGLAGLLAWGVAVVPPWAFAPSAGWAPPAAILFVCLALSLANEGLMRRRPPFTEPQWPASAFLMTLAAAAVILVLQGLRIIPAWSAA